MAIACNACLPPPTEEISTTISGDFKDPKVKMVLDLQDRQQTDSLLLLLNSKDATTRYWAAMAFASIKDKNAIDTLAKLLHDRLDSVKVAAAYSLGQIGDTTAQRYLIAAFDTEDTTGADFNKYVLEAIGKCGTDFFLSLMSSVTTYQVTDTALLEGQTLGIYHFMLRNIVHPSGTNRMLSLATQAQYPSSVRLIAASYLARGQNLGLDTLVSVDSTLSSIFEQEANAEIRMALALGVGKTKTELAKSALLRQFNVEQDYRVKCNIVRALKQFDYLTIRDTLFAALKDTNLHVVQTINEYLLEKGISRDANTYRRLAMDSTFSPTVQVELLTAANKHMPNYFTDYKSVINAALQQMYNQSKDVYVKAQALKGMSYYVRMYRYIADSSFASTSPILKTAAVEALTTICETENFDASFGASAITATQAIGRYLLQALQSQDAGMIALAAGALRTPARNFKVVLADSLPILEAVLQKIPLPNEIETYNELLHTIAHFKGIEFTPQKTAYNHPINWQMLDKITPSSKASIQTNKGEIILELTPQAAPGTVANFISLAKGKFYNDKVFHRVVPNFVIQGGCPRGDGYGGLDYTIRSELPPLRYNQGGLVGMASAGNHTEGTQFFITHSPALHLNGNYTIFAKVLSGMEVVNAIQVGDSIIEVNMK